MPFNLTPTNVMEVTVDARVFGVQVINRFNYVATAPTGTPAGDSGTFMSGPSGFITRYRSDILTALYPDYIVARYWLREITGADLIAPGPPSVWRTTYRAAYQTVAGGVLDIGGLPLPGGDHYLPLHEAFRLYKEPINPVRKYFKTGYNRYCPASHTQLLQAAAGDHDQWTVATRNALGNAFSTFAARIILADLPQAGPGYVMCLWSPAYFGRDWKPGGFDPWNATAQIKSTIVLEPYVGTQTTRRYSPTGRQRGS